MAAPSLIPAWRVPQTEEPGGLQCTGLKEPGTADERTRWLYNVSVSRRHVVPLVFMMLIHSFAFLS